MAPPHPLRRVSTGSLSSLARSQDKQPRASPSGLDFLQPALTELADEAATLAANVSGLTALHDALGTFNESFAAYLYALKMNAFCVEWPEAPDVNSFARAQSLSGHALTPVPEPQPEPAPAAPAGFSAADARPQSPASAPSAADMTYATIYSSADDGPAAASTPVAAPRGILKKQAAGGAGAGPAAPAAAASKGKTTAAMRKKRELEIAAHIDTLPLEFRGNDPAARLAMVKVIGRLMENPAELTLKEVVSPPDVPQPRANKCLIALVAKKLVVKVTVRGLASYRWVGA